MRRIRIEEGEVVKFTANTGRSWPAVVVKPPVVQICIEGDPFSIEVPLSEVACKRNPRRVSSQATTPRRERRRTTDMASEAVPSEAKQLRTRARELGIDYKNMTRVALRKAIAKAEEKEAGGGSKSAAKGKPASKPKASTTKPQSKKAADPAPESKGKKGGKSSKSAGKAKAPAKGKKAKVAEDSGEKKRPGRKPVDRSSIEPGTCPFTKGSDRAVVFGLLKKGGNRRKLAEALREKVTIRGEPGINDYDKRLTLIAKTLHDEWGYEIQKSGRGLEGKIKVVHPGQSKGKK